MLLRLNWGGRIFDARDGGTEIEVWSNSLSLEYVGATSLDTLLGVIAPIVEDYHTGGATGIDGRVGMDFIKLNEWSLITGHQITDPTVELIYSDSQRGGQAGSNPYNELSLAYRVSIDDATRNPRHRGGWFVPVPCPVMEATGRMDHAYVEAYADQAEIFLNALNALTDMEVVVWSRADEALHPVTRLRVGDVTDNISRRRNALREGYEVRTLA